MIIMARFITGLPACRIRHQIPVYAGAAEATTTFLSVCPPRRARTNSPTTHSPVERRMVKDPFILTLEDVAFVHPAVRFHRPRIVRSPLLAGGYVGAHLSDPACLAGLSIRSCP